MSPVSAEQLSKTPAPVKIKLEHVTRIEGHASLTVMLSEGRINSARLKYEEGARLFEGLLKGRKFYDAPTIASRICGVCPSVHNVTALKAVEGALGVETGPITEKLRRLLILAQWIQSHSLHAYFLALPDFLGAESAISMAEFKPAEVTTALEIKKLGNDIVYAIGGRSVHPITTLVGGFSLTPPATRLAELRRRLEEAMPEAARLARLLGDISVPDFSRKTTYLALHSDDEYAYYSGDVCSSEGYCATPADFCATLREVVVPGTAAKAGVHAGEGFFTGALARVNMSRELLQDSARSILEDSGYAFPSYNTFLNSFCQAVELVHAMAESIDIIDSVLENGLGPAEAVGDVEIKAGSCVAATEAPRGTLYHSYTLDGEGFIVDDNIITPTAQNLTNIEDDINQFVEERQDWEPSRLIEAIECLVRAYDPCVSCAVH